MHVKGIGSAASTLQTDTGLRTPSGLGAVLRAQELVAQGCGRAVSKESSTSFQPERKL